MVGQNSELKLPLARIFSNNKKFINSTIYFFTTKPAQGTLSTLIKRGYIDALSEVVESVHTGREGTFHPGRSAIKIWKSLLESDWPDHSSP